MAPVGRKVGRKDSKGGITTNVLTSAHTIVTLHHVVYSGASAIL